MCWCGLIFLLQYYHLFLSLFADFLFLYLVSLICLCELCDFSWSLCFKYLTPQSSHTAALLHKLPSSLCFTVSIDLVQPTAGLRQESGINSREKKWCLAQTFLTKPPSNKTSYIKLNQCLIHFSLCDLNTEFVFNETYEVVKLLAHQWTLRSCVYNASRW